MQNRIFFSFTRSDVGEIRPKVFEHPTYASDVWLCCSSVSLMHRLNWFIKNPEKDGRFQSLSWHVPFSMKKLLKLWIQSTNHIYWPFWLISRFSILFERQWKKHPSQILCLGNLCWDSFQWRTSKQFLLPWWTVKANLRIKAGGFDRKKSPWFVMPSFNGCPGEMGIGFVTSWRVRCKYVEVAPSSYMANIFVQKRNTNATFFLGGYHFTLWRFECKNHPGAVARVAASDTTGLDDLEELSDLESVSHWERALSEARWRTLTKMTGGPLKIVSLPVKTTQKWTNVHLKKEHFKRKKNQVFQLAFSVDSFSGEFNISIF